mmetsp:Transcript_13687/g.24543  ORF Transcript_13687/g.24543 Transcript_13687/m.24543 type:complete len:232 (+) Transcript_13687:83-778(+)
MKYLDCPELTQLMIQTNGLEVGDCQLELKMEAYSCKLAGSDKKLCKSLEQQFACEMSDSPKLGVSPVGPLSEPGSRRILINLICTMNACNPDYDFSSVNASQLIRENDVYSMMQKVDSFLQPVYLQLGQSFRQQLVDALNAVVNAQECDIYSFVPDVEDGEHPFSSAGKLWSFNYFLYNRRQKKILFFACGARSRLSEVFESDEEFEGEPWQLDSSSAYENSPALFGMDII